VLVGWLRQYSYEVTSQWHLTSTMDDDDTQYQYCDIVIVSPSIHNQPVVILELLATGTDKEIDEHFTRSLEYSIINFTRADDTLSNPHWQNKEQAADGLNVMHIWHDMNFKT
ncbi:1069_t:CDS:1, partial [Paraglomus brasilianum]